MRASSLLQQAAAARAPLIKFIGKRTVPKSVDHSPRAHPASPSSELPESFATYRAKAQQHGPLNYSAQTNGIYGGAIGGQPGASLGSVEPKKGEYFDRNELPERFRRLTWSQEEIDAVETGGASLFA
ncbi:conserved hypothetical protein [Histoplasma capsulatum var. duboisii H88]|uniref:Ribosomal protein YMR-31 n=4 Tax=Ajellomyces capsulatus TaxID=5037 RepID=C0NGB5_AJECG|nr:uncharacterized protein HCBG_02387 [Histoplasma capsulatum G186AR]EER43636.1 conserved hypothetical protein [Histoplasma capsulatum H143]EGC42163.1 conserved hypothetical protein [Histoplasma capsulatum var. duboisii H88]KAG5303840.1 DUF2638 superfamily domain-containing protein, nitrosative stress-induced transcript [Histoplasma capsulatum]EEH08850.1 conserved hypothetical protein [Histoplasma capsulatum G186AR]QSS51416.1 DUF2638 superfamily domain-containing protein, nitrosative stress-in